MSLFEIIKALQDAPTKNGGKKAVLEAHKDNELLKQYLKAVYDPRINYYTKKIPVVAPGNMATLDIEFIDWIIRTIAGRQITGKAAAASLKGTMAAMDAEGQELVGYIIGRDIRAGVGESTILEVFPGLFYIPPYQRCATMNEARLARFEQMKGFYVQTKSDGQFCYAINCPHRKQAMSRAGSMYPEWLAHQITYGIPIGYVAMGELLVVRDGKLMSRKDGNGVLNSVLSGDGSKFNAQTDDVRFVAWDMVTEDEFDVGESNRPYKERWLKLLECTNIDTIPCWWIEDVKSANRIHAEHTARGEEGTVWKNPEMGWRDCSSGDKDMLKVKVVFEGEYKITGAYEGEGKAKGMLGGFSLATSDELIKFNCGSGYSDDQRKEFWRLLQADPQAFNDCIVTAEGNDIITNKSKPGKEAVSLPIFVEIRFDKREADSRERVWQQFEAARTGKSEE